MSFQVKEPVLVIGLGGAGSKLANEAKNTLNSDCLIISNDSKDFSSENEFGLVTCFGNTIVHLSTEDEILDLFKQIRYALSSDGTFLGQIINYDLILNENRDSLPTIENEKIRFVRDYHIADDQSNIIFETELTIKDSSENISSSVNLMPMRKATLENLLKLAGFDTVKFYSDFNRSTFDSSKLPLVFEAK